MKLADTNARAQLLSAVIIAAGMLYLVKIVLPFFAADFGLSFSDLLLALSPGLGYAVAYVFAGGLVLATWHTPSLTTTILRATVTIVSVVIFAICTYALARILWSSFDDLIENPYLFTYSVFPNLIGLVIAGGTARIAIGAGGPSEPVIEDADAY